MITGTILKNGDVKLILTGTDEIDNAVLKRLNGATVSLITDNMRIGEKAITHGLIIVAPSTKSDTKEFEPNSK